MNYIFTNKWFVGKFLQNFIPYHILNTVDQDQMASSEVSLSGSALIFTWWIHVDNSISSLSCSFQEKSKN